MGPWNSGKSSLILALTGLLDYIGSLKIDGKEIRYIPPRILRSRLTIIPQDPVILDGTVRENLNPVLEEHADTNPTPPQVDDSVMIDTMTRLRIWDHIESLGGLDANLKELNLSLGQKQIMSMARAMIHHFKTQSKVVLMDEATSSMDPDTELYVQELIDEVFVNCTIILIAHREEALDCLDLLVEMSSGRMHTPDRGMNGWWWHYITNKRLTDWFINRNELHLIKKLSK